MKYLALVVLTSFLGNCLIQLYFPGMHTYLKNCRFSKKIPSKCGLFHQSSRLSVV